MRDEYEERERFLKAMKKLDKSIDTGDPNSHKVIKTINIGNKKVWDFTEKEKK